MYVFQARVGTASLAERVDAHLEAARAHDNAAAVFARRGDLASAEQAWAFAANERAMHAAALARHPEWTP
jgi:hypothetical protein